MNLLLMLHGSSASSTLFHMTDETGSGGYVGKWFEASWH